MVVAAGRDERRLVAVPLHHVEAEDVAVEGERAVDVGDLQVDVTDVDSRVEAHAADDSVSRRTRFDTAVAQRLRGGAPK